MRLIYFCTSWLFGLWVAGTATGGEVAPPVWAVTALLGFIGVMFVPRREQAIQQILTVLFGVCMGAAWMALNVDVRCEGEQLCALKGQPRDVTVVGWVSAEPAIDEDLVDLRIRANTAIVRNL